MASNQIVQEVLNGSRHEHKLCLTKGLRSYTCNGCKQSGANKGFKCPSCPEVLLHESCAELPDEYIHPSFSQQVFKFRSETLLRHHCDGCGEVLRGFVFESGGQHLKLHPLCMALPANLSYSGHEDHSLKLVPKEGKYSCTDCNKSNLKWKYRCETIACKVNLDMNCAKLDYFGLSEHGVSQVQRATRGKQTLQKLADKGKSVVSKVTSDLFHGFGEGVGGALVYEAFDDEENGDGDEK